MGEVCAGKHEGMTKYTIGQRARIPGRVDANKYGPPNRFPPQTRSLTTRTRHTTRHTTNDARHDTTHNDNHRLYVVDKSVENNSVTVAEGADHPALLTDSLYASDVHWISGTPQTLQVHTRHTRHTRHTTHTTRWKAECVRSR